MNGYSEFLCTDRQLQWSVFSPSELNRRPVVIVYVALRRKAEDEPSVMQLFHWLLWTEVEATFLTKKKKSRNEKQKKKFHGETAISILEKVRWEVEVNLLSASVNKSFRFSGLLFWIYSIEKHTRTFTCIHTYVHI